MPHLATPIALLPALVLLLAPAAGARAEERGSLDLERTWRAPAIVHPVPDVLDAVEAAEDAARAIEALAAAEALIRETLSPVPRRPDLGYDVTSGIQSRALRDALRPR